MERENSRPAAVAEINITPMIDVLLVLLIIFMVVVPVASRSIDTALPADKSPGPEPDPQPVPLVMTVQPASYSLNQLPIASLAELESQLRNLLETRPDKTLFVRVEGSQPYGRVVEALDHARGAGATRLGIMAYVPGR
jgi:biopolymer transport protein ExbD